MILYVFCVSFCVDFLYNPSMIALALSHNNLSPDSYQWGIDDFACQCACERWKSVAVIPMPQFRQGVLKYYQLDGLIAFINNETMSLEAQELNIPVVNLSACTIGKRFPTVTADNFAVGKMAANYFFERRYRNFGFVASKDTGDYAMERGIGFARSIASLGGKLSWFGPIPEEINSLVSNHAQGSIGKWLKHSSKPFAVFAAQDSQAAEVKIAANALQISVPRQVSILGVGNDAGVRDLADNISSISLPRRTVGYEAAMILNRMMEGKAPQKNLVMVPPSDIITRSSSDTIAINDEIVLQALYWLDEHACENINVSSLMKVLPLGRRAFERRFQKALGMTPLDRIQQIRILRAQQLLLNTNMTIDEISSNCGFTDRNRFFIVFRNLIGCAPSHFRNNHTSCFEL